jgi:hypothetical protein
VKHVVVGHPCLRALARMTGSISHQYILTVMVLVIATRKRGGKRRTGNSRRGAAPATRQLDVMKERSAAPA